MPDLDFRVEGVEPERFALAPQLMFKLRVTESNGTPIHSVVLRCQVQIEPGRRRYAAAEQDRLVDLFGTPDRWGKTVRPLLWTQTSVQVPPFNGSTLVDLPVPCSYDFSLAATKYFYGLEEGEIPLSFLFSGTVFYEAPDAGLQVAQIPWEKEAHFRLPVPVWKDLMDRYYPNSAWLCLRREVFDHLSRYKSRRGLPTWEQALEELLAAAQEPVQP
jgi:uncharacterized protein DUF6084